MIQHSSSSKPNNLFHVPYHVRQSRTLIAIRSRRDLPRNWIRCFQLREGSFLQDDLPRRASLHHTALDHSCLYPPASTAQASRSVRCRPSHDRTCNPVSDTRSTRDELDRLFGPLHMVSSKKNNQSCLSGSHQSNLTRGSPAVFNPVRASSSSNALGSL